MRSVLSFSFGSIGVSGSALSFGFVFESLIGSGDCGELSLSISLCLTLSGGSSDMSSRGRQQGREDLLGERKSGKSHRGNELRRSGKDLIKEKRKNEH